ncbi:leucine-rich repeat domain-containing protein [uncultured Porphyromonas sp.]|uniref:leucine-rich repeat domain-containing protein n=1 Tax=uncultured Porphyromonas sp. TaxID=159274 RepID=UPI002621007A|nr:leucine-rich repeat domain-containing protein [uncultured Porphyromonas sp.]
MSKHFRIWLFPLLGTLLTSTSLLAQGVITMTTSQRVGEEIALRIEANGNVTIEGAQKTGKKGANDRKSYRLTSQTITIRGDVTELDCYNSELTSLDVSKNAALTNLECGENKLTSLNVSKNTALTELTCYSNQLTSLDVSKNTALTFLNCSDNQLTSLDVSKNTALETLYCYNNQLTSLNVSQNTALETLYCPNNKLTNLNVSGCARLTIIDCSSNYIKGKAMTKLVNSLPNRRKKSSGTIFLVDRSSERRDKNRYSAADVTTAKRKNWEVRQY